MLEIGLKHTSELTVSEGLTAIQMGSGDMPVLASWLLEATGQQAYYRHVGGIVRVEELAEPLQPSSLAVVHR